MVNEMGADIHLPPSLGFSRTFDPFPLQHLVKLDMEQTITESSPLHSVIKVVTLRW